MSRCPASGPARRTASSSATDFAAENLSEWLGGPSTYTTERGAPMLRRRHHAFDIDAAARDAWMACMRQALDDIGADAALRDELLAAFGKVAEHLKNTDTDSTHRSH